MNTYRAELSEDFEGSLELWGKGIIDHTDLYRNYFPGYVSAMANPMNVSVEPKDAAVPRSRQ